MAISVGDASIKFLNEKQNKKVTKNFINNIKSEVTQVRESICLWSFNWLDVKCFKNIFKICWHPSKENIIAFGTKDGKVGLIDTMANNK